MSGIELTPFQVLCLSTLRDLADRWDVGFREVGRNSYGSDVGVEVDVDWVPLEVTSDQVSICTPYNGRTFELSSYESEQELLSDLSTVMEEFVRDPILGRHPIVRLAIRLSRLVRHDHAG
jgi:hypothetical protein